MKRMLFLVATLALSANLLVAKEREEMFVEDADYKALNNALQAVDATKAKKAIADVEEKTRNSDKLKELVTQKNESGETPLKIVARAYIKKIKQNPSMKEEATKNIQQILPLLVDRKANLLDLKEFTKKGRKNYDSVIAAFYDRRTVSTKPAK